MLTVRGYARKVLPDLGRDLHFQVRRRSEQGHSVSFFSPDPPPAIGRSLVLHTQYSWGHSAGGISITAHLATTPANPPFKAVIFVGPCDPRTSFDITDDLTQLNYSYQVTRTPSTRLTARNIKQSTTSWWSSPDARQLRTLWNVSVLLHMPPSRMLLKRLPYSSHPTDWILPGASASTGTSSRSP